MDFDLGPDAEAFRERVRTFLAANVTDEVIEGTHGGTIHDWDLHRKIADEGWLHGAVPAELGGEGTDPVELMVLVEELQLHRAPMDAMGNNVMIASVILEVGNEFLKGEVVPKLLDGTSLVSLGYSEPESGSDVAAAQTRAVRDGDEWVITGQKMWTTMAHEADYVLLLTRTNPDVRKHKGLTMFVVPLDSAGVEVQPVWTMATERTNATFYDDVRIDDRWRIGEVDGGWAVMKVALKYERGIAGGQFPSAPVIDAVLDHARRTGQIDEPVVREKLVRAMIDLEVSRIFAYRLAWMASEGLPFSIEGSMTKLWASETYKRHCDWFLDLEGPEGMVRHGEPGATADGIVEENWRHAPVTTIYGGTSEIQRNMVAEQRLGLPRARR